jgi:hypothetical protein
VPELELNVYQSSSESVIPETPVPIQARERIKRTRSSMDSRKSSNSNQQPPAEVTVVSKSTISAEPLPAPTTPANVSHSKEDVIDRHTK